MLFERVKHDKIKLGVLKETRIKAENHEKT